MVTVEYDKHFVKKMQKIKDNSIKEKIKKQIEKLIESPEIGKPMRFSRKGTRELYLSPFRLSYIFVREENKVIFLSLYHKDEQ